MQLDTKLYDILFVGSNSCLRVAAAFILDNEVIGCSQFHARISLLLLLLLLLLLQLRLRRPRDSISSYAVTASAFRSFNSLMSTSVATGRWQLGSIPCILYLIVRCNAVSNTCVSLAWSVCMRTSLYCWLQRKNIRQTVQFLHSTDESIGKYWLKSS